ncbi:MarR family transcriptional regulator [Iamia majanohamensis]|uniref:MarR family transcriptional regulator n=1 Tax=Iamia majanohamensis TaxID=467976 RepID=A0AAE9Y447_9ACTN|nr:MarR family transcriptional regulator [Iamia majanohamensis]WCO65839.1 MarR family transcriptional regulator [Iamia majanohamensis]
MTSHPTSVALAPADRAEATSRLRLAVGRLSRRMRQESSLGHSLTQIGILATLDRAGATTLGDLAAIERVSPPTITKAVGTLVGEGLVEKVADPDDRRVVRATLTEAGRRDLDAMRSKRDAWLATRLAALDDDDLARLVDLVPVLEALTAEEPHPDDPTDPPS